MKLTLRKAALLNITENIEMESFSSEEPCMVIPARESEEVLSLHQRHLEHPLVSDGEDDPEPQIQIQPRPQTKPYTASPAKEGSEHGPPALSFMEEIEIEMEVSQYEGCDPTASSNKASRLKWRSSTQKTGLVVKDVFCLPREHYLQLDRHIVPRGRQRAALLAMGMTARITIDCGWSANQVESRLVALFRGRFVTWKGQKFSFTYLQCVPGSRVLFVPDTPAEGWTGEQLLRISGHGPLFILSHQDCPQAESEQTASDTPALDNRKEFCLEANTESCQDEDSLLGKQSQPHVRRNTEKFALDLDTILRLFRQENMDRDVETQVQVRRRDLLHSALREVRRPGFCFRTTPVISFSGEEADGHEGPLREFFRLALLKLQQSSVFEGQPGRLFLTYDLAALEDGKYYEAGVLIGWSLAQGGPGPRCLHPALYQLMCGQSPSLDDFSWRDVVDTEVQIRVKQLQSCTDVKLLSASLCDWVSSCGIPQIYSACSDEMPAVYIRLVKHYIYHRVASMISQFTEGMNSCGGLWDMVRSHWEAFVPVMTSTQQHPPTLEELQQLFIVCYSRPDSQLRAAEEML
ncbi:hypothetical protein PAMP_023926 [Pampus punctatissimus]